MKNLIPRLDALCEEAWDNDPSINNGGCCVFAALVGRALANNGVKVWGKSVGREWEYQNGYYNSADTVRHLTGNSTDMLDWEENDFSFYHVVLCFKYKGRTYQVDAEQGVTRVKRKFLDGRLFGMRGFLLPGKITLDELEEFADNGEWNPTFDREDGIPLIEDAIENWLSGH